MSDYLTARVVTHLSRLENIALEMQAKSTRAFNEARQTDADINMTAKVASYSEAQAWSIASHMLTDPIRDLSIAESQEQWRLAAMARTAEQSHQEDPFPEGPHVHSQGWVDEDDQVALDLGEDLAIELTAINVNGRVGVGVLEGGLLDGILRVYTELEVSKRYVQAISEAAYSKTEERVGAQDLLAYVERLAVDAQKWRKHIGNPFADPEPQS